MTTTQLINLPSDDAAEEAARRLDHCPVCGSKHADQAGHLCCWRCFKQETPNGAQALKWSGLGYRDWLELTLP